MASSRARGTCVAQPAPEIEERPLTGCARLLPCAPGFVRLQVILRTARRRERQPAKASIDGYLAIKGLAATEDPSRHLVPPELARLTECVSDQKDRRRHAGRREPRSRVGYVVHIAIVERYGNCVVGQGSVLETPHDLRHRERRPMLSQHFHVRGEAVRMHGQPPWIDHRRGDAVIHQNQRLRSRGPQTIADAPKQSSHVSPVSYARAPPR